MTGDYKTAETILKVTERMYRVTEVQLKAKARSSNHVAWARHMAFYAIREMTAFSFPDIGHLFNRDHSTVIYGHDKVAHAATNGKAQEVAYFMRSCRDAATGLLSDDATIFEQALRALLEPAA